MSQDEELSCFWNPEVQRLKREFQRAEDDGDDAYYERVKGVWEEYYTDKEAVEMIAYHFMGNARCSKRCRTS